MSLPKPYGGTPFISGLVTGLICESDYSAEQAFRAQLQISAQNEFSTFLKPFQVKRKSNETHESNLPSRYTLVEMITKVYPTK